MKKLIACLLLITAVSCQQKQNKSVKSDNTTAEKYNTFDKRNHLQPLFDRTKFDTLRSWGLGWALLEPINIAKGDEDEIELSKRFSPGQKALYFIWYLDAEVMNGGFIQFYWNYQDKYIPAISKGLKLIGDTSMFNLVGASYKEYLTHKIQFVLQREKDDWQPLYDNLKKFGELDSLYYAKHDQMMASIEKYARQYPQEFIKFK